MIYLDNNATTPIDLEVKKAMLPYLEGEFANPSGFYPAAKLVKYALEEARMALAKALYVKDSRSIIFTSGGTESNNTAIRSALKCLPHRRTIVTTSVEHSSIYFLCQELEEEGYTIKYIPVTRVGGLDLDALQDALGPDVAIASIMWANNETGVLFPIQDIARIVKKQGILFHVDAVQACGKVAIDLSDIQIDYLSASAHKFHGPKGAGILYVRSGALFSPLLYGGKQEHERRAGTENVSGVIGMSTALNLAVSHLSEYTEQVSFLRDRLETGLCSQISRCVVNGADLARLPNTLNMTIPDVNSEALLIRMGELGICASSGSACQTGALEPSHVLLAMGRSRDEALSSVRFSLSRFTTQSEIDFALDLVPKIVEELREIAREESKV